MSLTGLLCTGIRHSSVQPRVPHVRIVVRRVEQRTSPWSWGHSRTEAVVSDYQFCVTSEHIVIISPPSISTTLRSFARNEAKRFGGSGYGVRYEHYFVRVYFLLQLERGRPSSLPLLSLFLLSVEPLGVDFSCRTATAGSGRTPLCASACTLPSTSAWSSPSSPDLGRSLASCLSSVRGGTRSPQSAFVPSPPLTLRSMRSLGSALPARLFRCRRTLLSSLLLVWSRRVWPLRVLRRTTFRLSVRLRELRSFSTCTNSSSSRQFRRPWRVPSFRWKTFGLLKV